MLASEVSILSSSESILRHETFPHIIAYNDNRSEKEMTRGRRLRNKRYVLHKHKWNRCFLTWAFRDPFDVFSNHRSFRLARDAIRKAILTWQKESGRLLRLVDISPSIKISKVPSAEMQKRNQRRVAHIDLFFARYAHGDLESFDGTGGLVAHTGYPMEGIVHFDGSESWSVGNNEKLIKNGKENTQDPPGQGHIIQFHKFNRFGCKII
ncbi:matrixin domain-containing protein [Ditylenchus destructor]|uniref:Matrixin domain-containing protein n=1 Tax=Ditylenchus destructor TaxID=166010 RepID=A0AAD4N5R2_9BILA|nr:matrixin domain-containing protein [Ditylenchus destructor]